MTRKLFYTIRRVNEKVLSNPDNMVLKEVLEIYRDVDREQCRKLLRQLSWTVPIGSPKRKRTVKNTIAIFLAYPYGSDECLQP